MAHASNTLIFETQFGDKRVKMYKVAMTSGQTVTSAIVPGLGFGSPVGAYDNYSVSSGSYTFTTQNPGAASKYCTIAFFSPVGVSA